ncbi:histone-lysine N-methyltransferase PRDM9-like isoform X2 [Zootermopsis nevadensis]|nr:histone-lysine N-methyltransferase PRDM9-like isoform X2 [Zootermopsis nevadensis]XP_021927982.1 histone-lysine N-methyltransferase PRDM9-like isoform X2 [Zootermopsis nevadensis]XP_021927984.1 histone-lysine N-methyltransferase PRDM9-like isoform X2 [Zootermopsis nevadensis]
MTKRKSEEQKWSTKNKCIKFKPQIKRKDGNVSIKKQNTLQHIPSPAELAQDTDEDFLGFPEATSIGQIVGLSALKDAIRKLESELESLVEAENGSEKESDVPGRRYPKRSLARKNYMEGNVLDDDEYIFCDDCHHEWEGDCPVHGALTVVEDTKVPAHPGDPTRADRTVPFQLCIAQSGISDAGCGVWTRVPLRKGLRFGPYEGAKLETSNSNGYCWQIHHNSRPLYCVDAKDCGVANWMRYVNCARHAEELNLMAFQYKGEIYYRTFQHIPAHVELLVWYGDEYGRLLGIDVKNFHKPQQKQCHSVFRCVGCGTTYSSPLYLENHKIYCRGLKGIRLTQSGREFGVKSIQSNSIHTKVHCGHDSNRPTSINYVKPVNLSIKGDMCDKDSHMDDKPYVCEECGHKFARRGTLKTHMRSHTGEKPFECEECGHKFTQRGHLKTHMRSHTGEKPFECEECGLKFTEGGTLKRHMRSHTGEKPFECEECGNKFARRGYLNIHMRSHTGEKPFECEE